VTGGVQRQPTVKEVAERAGVSPMTVSRTLSGGVNVRPEVQARVLAAVQELGYHRNENARSIRPGQSSGLIGVAITNIANPYYGTFALGLEEEVARTGRRIILGNTSEDVEREAQLVRDLIGRQVEGLVIVPAGTHADHLKSTSIGTTPVVLASRRVYGLDVDSVVLDDVGGSYRGTIAMLDRGHQRIAFLGNSGSIFTGERRYAGYEKALRERGIPVNQRLVAQGQQDIGQAEAAMRHLLDLEVPPTAVFSANNRNTIGALKEIGRRMASRGDPAAGYPEIVSFDDFELSEMMPVPVTVIQHDPRELGRVAASLLLSRLSGQSSDAPATTIEMPVKIVVAPGFARAR
jgi:LacI family transcriptional regulator